MSRREKRRLNSRASLDDDVQEPNRGGAPSRVAMQGDIVAGATPDAMEFDEALDLSQEAIMRVLDEKIAGEEAAAKAEEERVIEAGRAAFSAHKLKAEARERNEVEREVGIFMPVSGTSASDTRTIVGR